LFFNLKNAFHIMNRSETCIKIENGLF
jgi:hypothetical protein